MNRKITPWLILAVLVLGAAAWLTQSARQSASRNGTIQSRGARVLALDSSALTQVRVRQDYWNSFTLVRRPGGSWEMLEPSPGPADQETVRRFLETLVSLPALRTLETPADDSERYRQYGLWNPKLTITASTAERDYTITFGNATDDQSGTYCILQGRDETLVTASESVTMLSKEPAAYRPVPGGVSTPPRAETDPLHRENIPVAR